MAGAKPIAVRAFARRCGTFLSLAALTLLALSFVQVHKHDLAFSGFDRSDVLSATHVRATQQAAEQLPSRLADDNDHCPICFSSFLLSNSSVPDPPSNPHSLHFAEIDPEFNPVSDRVFQSRHAAFLSRAPPAVWRLAATSVLATGYFLRGATQEACVTWWAITLRVHLRPPSPLVAETSFLDSADRP
ncbi:hypothetical protein [Bradyrhizobium sp.]|uniref:hypothetical protein n=1 Tax=Bradyrhizobium sp. TaxID=376 RepID=UPI002BE5AAEF|nr:hypothetical protein [Bradyrhizobium sp.]HWX58962.1 hypothetical protein [Bradyrhizobium sp.]